MFLVNAMEYGYEVIFPIWQGAGEAGGRKNLVNDLREFKEFRKISFRKEKDKKRTYLDTTNKKITEYLKR
jgi:hypothetical protein